MAIKLPGDLPQPKIPYQSHTIINCMQTMHISCTRTMLTYTTSHIQATGVLTHLYRTQ